LGFVVVNRGFPSGYEATLLSELDECTASGDGRGAELRRANWNRGHTFKVCVGERGFDCGHIFEVLKAKEVVTGGIEDEDGPKIQGNIPYRRAHRVFEADVAPDLFDQFQDEQFQDVPQPGVHWLVDHHDSHTPGKAAQVHVGREHADLQADDQPRHAFSGAFEHAQHPEQAREITIVRNDDVLWRFQAEVLDLFRVQGDDSLRADRRLLLCPLLDRVMDLRAAVAECRDTERGFEGWP